MSENAFARTPASDLHDGIDALVNALQDYARGDAPMYTFGLVAALEPLVDYALERHDEHPYGSREGERWATVAHAVQTALGILTES